MTKKLSYKDPEKQLKQLEGVTETGKLIKFGVNGDYTTWYARRLELEKEISKMKSGHREGSLGEDQESILI